MRILRADHRATAVAVGALVLAVAASPAPAGNVLVFSSGDAATDAAVVARLQGFGHSATLGPAFNAFDGTQSLAGYGVVYLQANVNWTSPDMPVAGQTAIVNFVHSGGGLVTSEWVVWKWAVQGEFQTLGTVFGVTASATYDGAAPVTYTAATPDPIVNSGLPASFAFAVDNYGGTETFLVPAVGATAFYSASTGAAGVVGRSAGSGRVLHLSTTMGASSIADASCGRLLSNAVNWAGRGCPGDYDGNGRVEPADISLFVNVWFTSLTGGTLAGDFDGNGAVQPADVSLFVAVWFAGVTSGC